MSSRQITLHQFSHHHYHHCVPHLKVFKCSEKGFGRKQGGGRLMPSIRVNRASIRDVNGARPLIIMERYPASPFQKRWQNDVYFKLFLTIAMLRSEQQQLWMVYCDKRGAKIPSGMEEAPRSSYLHFQHKKNLSPFLLQRCFFST